MEKPRVEIKYVDVDEQNGYLRISVNGLAQPSIRIDFDSGNSCLVHDGLYKLIDSVYAAGFNDGEWAGKCKVRDLLKWAEAR